MWVGEETLEFGGAYSTYLLQHVLDLVGWECRHQIGCHARLHRFKHPQRRASLGLLEQEHLVWGGKLRERGSRFRCIQRFQDAAPFFWGELLEQVGKLGGGKVPQWPLGGWRVPARFAFAFCSVFRKQSHMSPREKGPRCRWNHVFPNPTWQ